MGALAPGVCRHCAVWGAAHVIWQRSPLISVLHDVVELFELVIVLDPCVLLEVTLLEVLELTELVTLVEVLELTAVVASVELRASTAPAEPADTLPSGEPHAQSASAAAMVRYRMSSAPSGSGLILQVLTAAGAPRSSGAGAAAIASGYST